MLRIYTTRRQALSVGKSESVKQSYAFSRWFHLSRSFNHLPDCAKNFTPAGEPRVKGGVLNKTRAGPILTDVFRRGEHASHSCKKKKKNPRLGCHSVVAQWLSSCRPSSILITNCAITVLEPACSMTARYNPGEPYPVLTSQPQYFPV